MASFSGTHSPDAEKREWRPRRYCLPTVLFACGGFVCLGISALVIMLDMMPEIDATPLIEILPPFNHEAAIGASVFSLICAIASEAVSRNRVPPPTWRVRAELERALIDLGLLDGKDTSKWRGIWWCAPKGQYDRRAHLFTLLFDCRTVKATPEVFSKLGQSIAGFHKSQDAAIVPYERSGKRACMKLMLWYGNPFSDGAKELDPFRKG